MKYKSLQEFIDQQKRDEQHRKRLADKLFHTVRSGNEEEIQAVVSECSRSKLDFTDVKHDYLLEYFDSFRTLSVAPSAMIIRLLLNYQKRITNKAKLSFYQNVFYKNLLKEEELYEISSLITDHKSITSPAHLKKI